MKYVKVSVDFFNLPIKRLAQYLSGVLPGYYTLLTDCIAVQRDLAGAWSGYQIGVGAAGDQGPDRRVCSRVVVGAYDSSRAVVGDVHEIAFLCCGNLVYATLSPDDITFTAPLFEKAKKKIKELFSSLPFFKGISFWDCEMNDEEPAPKYLDVARRLESGEITYVRSSGTIRTVPRCSSDLTKKGASVDEHNFAVIERADKRITVSLNGVDLVFIQCPRGRFVMGSPSVRRKALPNGYMTDSHHLCYAGDSCQGGRQQNETMREVELTRDFWILETPVTQRAWTALMGYNPSGDEELDYPVDQVSYFMTLDFIAQLNKFLTKSHYECRLPTEAEWEYASRAGVPNSREYDDQKNIYNLGWPDSRVHQVKRREPNKWGIYDMLGNVAEWVADWYDPDDVQRNLRVDPVGPPTGDFKVLRGGGFFTNYFQCRSAYRHFAPPQMRYSLFGFRLVLTKAAVAPC